jgi:hypothetical protein
MRPGVEHFQLIACLGCLMRDHGAGEARSNHSNFLHMSPLYVDRKKAGRRKVRWTVWRFILWAGPGEGLIRNMADTYGGLAVSCCLRVIKRRRERRCRRHIW